MRRGSKGQKGRKSDANNDVDEEVSSLDLDTSSSAKKRTSRSQGKGSEENGKIEDTEQQENGKAASKRKKDENEIVEAESDVESDKPVNKKKKDKEDKDNNDSIDSTDVDADESPSKKKKEKKGKEDSASKSTKKGKAAKKEESEDEEEYEVEKIVDQRTIKGRRQFLVRWVGYSEEHDTWEQEENVNCDNLIEEFLAEQEANGKEQKEAPAKKGKQVGKKTKGKSPKKEKKSNGVSKDSKDDDNDNENDDDDDDDSKEYEVEKIIEVHFKKDKSREFLIRWKGFSSKSDTWEPEENLNCPELINKFMEKLEKIKSLDSRELRTNPSHTSRYTLTMHSDKRQSRRNVNKQRKTYYECD